MKKATLPAIVVTGLLMTGCSTQGNAVIPIVGPLASFASYESVGSFTVSGDRPYLGKIRRNRLDDTYDITTTFMTIGDLIRGMTGFTSLDNFITSARTGLVVVRGASTNCPTAQWAVWYDDNQTVIHPFSGCQPYTKNTITRNGEYVMFEDPTGKSDSLYAFDVRQSRFSEYRYQKPMEATVEAQNTRQSPPARQQQAATKLHKRSPAAKTRPATSTPAATRQATYQPGTIEIKKVPSKTTLEVVTWEQ
ncbi:hypothetical protein Aerorivi_01730 [Aeromonas rivipollensis]|uniref:Lipoprotein n=1 Tax=Aeromonas salmonicida TaxID=645 RepID=A0AAX1PPT1_AERSA|nr:hypothetical protein [Aeromonas salmonicida]RAJ09798.1 hypothetical protein DEU50_101542 [Aeromonas salmonicida]